MLHTPDLPGRDYVVITSAGFSLYWIAPLAFVAFPPHALEAVPPWSRMRVAAAGAWHNILSYGVMWALRASGIGVLVLEMLAWPLWENLDGTGLLVLGVDVVSFDSGAIEKRPTQYKAMH